MARAGQGGFTSCEAQRQACLEFIASQRDALWLPVAEGFDDVGLSGATAERPALDRLLDWAERGLVDRVVVHRLDRLTRSVRDWVRLAEILRRRGVSLTIVAGGLHEGELAMSDMVLGTLAAFAEFEREMIADRLGDARAARRERGLRTAGRVPFGYVADPQTRQLALEPKEAEAAKRFFEMAANGRPPSAVAAWANEQGVRTKVAGKTGGGPWSARAVLRLLGNPVYAGQLDRGDDVQQGVQPAIVSREQFERVQEAVRQRRTRAPAPRAELGRDDPFLLRGILVCASCGRRMTTSSSGAMARPRPGDLREAAQEPRRYYRCRGERACRGSQIAAQDIEASVLRWLSHPADGLPEDIGIALRGLAHSWELLWPINRRRLIEVLVLEVRWDGPAAQVQFQLDEDTVADLCARFRPRPGR